MTRTTTLILALLLTATARAQPGLYKTNLYSLSREHLVGEGHFNVKLAMDSKETLAVSSCNKTWLYYVNRGGRVVDSLEIPFESCIRNMEFDEYDRLLIMDNAEKNIYRHDREKQKFIRYPYDKPEDWYTLLNHYYKYFEISSIPTFYINKEFLQDAYYTRFDYSYNLWLNYADGFIYQSAYNFIRKIGNHRTYVSLKKSDLWFSERLSNKCKLLFINPATESAVYYNRALVLIYESFRDNSVIEYHCPSSNGEGVQFDFATNIRQKHVWGVSRFNAESFTIAVWKIRH